jgi:hypothetical protein
MLGTLIRDRRLRGLIAASTRLECKFDSPSLPMGFGILTRWTLFNRKRVFILGPSHHVYLSECALSRCRLYKTPIGDLPLDLESMSLSLLTSVCVCVEW